MNNIQKAKEIRRDIIESLYSAKSGHPGGSLSCVEILIALYYYVMNINPTNPKDPNRDRFVLSKGHACPALYAILADKGYFDKNELKSLRKFGSILQGHPDCKKTPGVDVNTGSLGQGASIAVGMAMAGKYEKSTYNIYALIGDGECDEGMIWEAAMAASHYKLDNLIFILDHNGLQIDGSNDEVMSIGNITKKFDSFGFECFEVDGHNVEEIVSALKKKTVDKPKFINCKTIKGKGVSFMENNAIWHGKAMNEEQYLDAHKEVM